MIQVKVGSIVTLSDNRRCLIVERGDLGKIAIPNGVTPVAADVYLAKQLLGKTIGARYRSDDCHIVKIEPSEYAEFVAERQRREEEGFRRVRERRLAFEQKQKAEAADRRILREKLQLALDEASRRLAEEQRAQQEKIEETTRKATIWLEKFDFMAADEYLAELPRDQRIKLKAKYVSRWFAMSVTYQGKAYTLDDEQAQAVLDNSKNTIVVARAGSGKTRTIVAKIIFLIAKYGLKPDDLLAFVFNRNAAKEINQRLEQILVNGKRIISNSEIASTFHAFAKKIVFLMCGEEARYGRILDNEQGLFVQAILEKMPKQKIYQFFRDESFRIKRDQFESDEDYYAAVRNSKYQTLDGKIVKSEAEKIICDFLFEHNIKYYYENEYYLSAARRICKPTSRKELDRLDTQFKQESIKPDFYLVDYDMPWEHWAITGYEGIAERERINKSGVIGDYDFYKNKMNWKRWFYRKEWLDRESQFINKYADQFRKFGELIETFKAKDTTREDFEQEIKELLESRGVKCDKLPEDELISKVWNSQIKKFTRMMLQFISRTEQQFLDDEGILERKIATSNTDLRTKAFLEIGWNCYQNYLAYLSSKKPKQNLLTKILRNNQEETINFDQYGIDFSLLIKRATEIIKSRTNPEVTAMLERKKYILIDEYQDFSQLFLKMIYAIRELCPEAKLFVVGDDWQAINRFAGSDVNYFTNFAEYFTEDTTRLEITTNYRCSQAIVRGASSFIQNSLGESGSYKAFSQQDGKIEIVNPTKTFIDYRPGEQDEDAVYKQNMVVAATKNPSKLAVQYLKTIVDIIKKNLSQGKILILHRNNDTSFWHIDLDNFCMRLKRTLAILGIMSNETFDQKIEIMTMHKAKGLEADVVIIMEADEGIIPSYHQDTCLYEVFGETEAIASDDQKRLFYVAMTRAKHNLYILHNEQKDARREGFIKDIELNKRILSEDSNKADEEILFPIF